MTLDFTWGLPRNSCWILWWCYLKTNVRSGINDTCRLVVYIGCLPFAVCKPSNGFQHFCKLTFMLLMFCKRKLHGYCACCAQNKCEIKNGLQVQLSRKVAQCKIRRHESGGVYSTTFARIKARQELVYHCSFAFILFVVLYRNVFVIDVRNCDCLQYAARNTHM